MIIFVVPGIFSAKAFRIFASVAVSTAEVEVVQNQDLRFLQQGPCNAQTLLLTARNIVARHAQCGSGNPSGIRSMNSSAQAAWQASMHSASVALGLPPAKGYPKWSPRKGCSSEAPQTPVPEGPPYRTSGHPRRPHRQSLGPHRIGGKSGWPSYSSGAGTADDADGLAGMDV